MNEDINRSFIEALIEKAIKEEHIEDEEEIEKEVEQYSGEKENISSRLIISYVKKFKFHLIKLKLRQVTEEILENQRGFIQSFADLIKKARKKCDFSEKKIAELSDLNAKDISNFEDPKTLLLNVLDLSKLIRILDVYGINIHKLANIINIEEDNLKISMRTGTSLNYAKGVGTTFENARFRHIRPNISEFLIKIREELDQEGLQHLL